MPPRPLALLTIPLVMVGIFVGASAADDGAGPSGAAPLTLQQAEQTALRNQPTVREAHGLLEAAEGRVEEARAGYLPQVTVTGTYERTTGNFATRPGVLPNNLMTSGMGGGSGTTITAAAAPVSWNPQFNYYQFNAGASQLIYDFGQTSKRWEAAGANRDAAGDNTRTATVQTLLTVRRAYFVARADHDLVAVAEETVRNQGKHVEQTQAFVRTGIQPDINLATVQTALANAKVSLVTAQNNYAVALAQLAQAMGVSVTEQYTLASEEFPPVAGEDGPNGPLVAQAEKNRPELANIVNQRRAQEATVGSIKGAYGPSLSAIANLSDTGVAIDALAPNWYIGLGLTWNILQGGLTRGQVREAKGTLENLTGQEQALRLQVQVDVEQGRLGVQAAKATIGAADEALVNARNQLTLAEKRYEHGLGSAVELDDAQVAYTTAEAQVVQAKFNLAAARAQLLAALGEQ
ncbi:MAG TPA: TolC family protein [Polyangia bacterium]|nr:TolC family protein [Polyangia bacterium]